jgi:nitrite reductase/ring-hydroxylating ferredoxin subunit/uncharacterized membrane protein
MEAQSAPLDVIERQEWLEPVEEGLQKAVSTAYESAGTPGQAVKNFLHGTWLGHPLHPALTDIPLGAWTAGAVLDILDASGDGEYAAGADAALTVGLAGAAGAAITGLTDWQSTQGKARRIGVVHGLLNLTSASLYTASLICRQRRDRSTGRLLSFLGYACSLGAAYLGGHLVYAQKVGVKHIEDESAPEDWTGVLAQSDLADGQMRRVEAKGFAVLLARREGRIHAIAETCSHMGGPLAEGKMEGDTVRCPWHGSRFSLEDGSVIDGPATMPQTCFEVRVRDGQIEVRARRE